MAKVLVIDDSALMRKITRDHLEAAGFQVEECLPETVSELMERVKAWTPDLVLSDFNMPSVNGQNVARAVRHVNPKTAVLVLTANRDDARDAMLLSMGVRKVLHKPIKAEELVEAVNKALRLI
jgi:two-component system chemotaxis response regulator CheY